MSKCKVEVLNQESGEIIACHFKQKHILVYFSFFISKDKEERYIALCAESTVRWENSGTARTVAQQVACLGQFGTPSLPDRTECMAVTGQQTSFLYAFQYMGGQIGDFVLRILLYKFFQSGEEPFCFSSLQSGDGFEEHKLRAMLP